MTDIKNISKILIPLITFALIVLIGIAITEGFSKSLRDSTTADGAIVVATLGAVNTSTSISTTYPFAQTLTSCISGANVTTTTSNSWCYQESADTTDQTGIDGDCGLNYSGSYDFEHEVYQNPANFYDGDWDTFTTFNYGYINYTKPLNALNTSLWQVKGAVLYSNNTIPLDCWDYDLNNLQFRVITSADGYSVWSCYNGTWNNLTKTSSGGVVYEEAMWWNITSSTTSSNSTDATNMFSFVAGDIVNEGTGTVTLNDNGSALVGEELNCTITYLADTDASDAAELFITGLTVFATFMAVIVLAIVGMIVISLFKSKG